MNPYSQLAKIAGYLSFSAVLVKADGTEIELAVKAENREDERLESTYPASIRFRTWSTAIADLTQADGTVVYPSDGDKLQVVCRDEVTREYSVCRESNTSRYWNWRYSTPGNRILFYTKYEGAEVADET